MNLFLYESSLPTPLNGMLLHTPSHIHDRFTPTSMEAREEARSIKPDKTEAWKRTPKVNLFLYESSLPTPLNGMLLHTPSHIHDRFTPTSMEAREEARSIKPDKTEAWKRRRKKTDRQMLSVARVLPDLATGTTARRHYRPLLPPATDDTSASQMLSVTGGTTGPGSGTTGPRHYRPLLPPPTDGSS